MLSIVVVDDEPRQRKGMQKLILSIYPEAIVTPVRDGAQALAFAASNSVDIVFTDIKMPIITGISLAERLSDIDRGIIVILVSAYADFEYARKAIQLGVFGYLLKPVDPDELRQLLDKAIKKLQSDAAARFAPLQAAESGLRSALTAHQRQRLFQWLQGAADAGDGTASALPLAGCNAGRMLLTCLSAEAYQTQGFDRGESGEFCISLMNWLAEAFENRRILSCAPENERFQIATVLLEPMSDDEIAAVLGRFADNLRKAYGFGATVFVSGPVTGLQSRVPEAYREALSALPLLFYQNGDGVVLAGSGNRLSAKAFLFPVSEYGLFKDHVLHNDADQAARQFHRMVAGVCSSSMPLPGLLLGAVAHFLLKLLGECDFLTEADRAVLSENILALRDCPSLQALTEGVAGLTMKLTGLCAAYFSNASPIQLSIRYIDQNYMKNLNLSQVSGISYYSPAYFSSIFKAEKGESFTSYLNRVRLTNAARLITATNLDISDIACRVGYTDAKYFNHLFKKLYGVTAQTYRLTRAETE